MRPQNDFGIWLRQLRTALDFTQETLADAVGCASQTVRSFEIGRRRPSREMAARLADILCVPPDERASFLQLARTPLPSKANVPTSARPQEQRPSGIVLPPDGLIGRYQDQERLRQAFLDEKRHLVTLLGPGGIGKTRLALQSAADLAEHFTDGACFVALAAVNDAAGVLTAIGVAVGCPMSSVLDPSSALVTFFRERTILLVLDNLEHLLRPPHDDAIAEFLTRVVREAPGVALLVTSRERLRLQAEWVVEIGGLSLPGDDQSVNVARSDAVVLFVERARRITGDFALKPENQAIVAAICRRLDGLPLALELAAAQVSFLSLPDLLARLDRALPLLEGGSRDLPARQRTMRATIGWSHELLSPDERLVFQRLGVLIGSFSLAAAEAIVVGDHIRSEQVLGLLRQLIDRSLMVRDGTAGDGVRYRLLEPVRQFAIERLEEHEDEARAARNRHAAFFQSVAEQLGPQMHMPQNKEAFLRLLACIDQEYANIQVAMNWLLDEQLDGVARIGWSMSIFWWYRSRQHEPRGWMEAVLAQRDHIATLTYARALFGLLPTVYGYDAKRSLEVSQEAIPLFEQSDDRQTLAQVLVFMGLARLQLGEHALAVDAFQRARDLGRSIMDEWVATEATTLLGLAWSYMDQHTSGKQCLEDGLAAALASDDTWNTSLSLYNRALVAYIDGDIHLVAQYCRSWLAFSPDLEMVNGSSVAFALDSLATSASAKGDDTRAARLLGAAEALAEIAGRFILVPNSSQYEDTLVYLRRRLATPVLATAWNEGRAMGVTRAVAFALGTEKTERAAFLG